MLRTQAISTLIDTSPRRLRDAQRISCWCCPWSMLREASSRLLGTPTSERRQTRPIQQRFLATARAMGISVTQHRRRPRQAENKQTQPGPAVRNRSRQQVKMKGGRRGDGSGQAVEETPQAGERGTLGEEGLGRDSGVGGKYSDGT